MLIVPTEARLFPNCMTQLIVDPDQAPFAVTIYGRCILLHQNILGGARFLRILANRFDGDMVKVLSWYDNEWGFSNRVVDALLKMA